MPAHIYAGDLLLMLFVNDGTATASASGWTEIFASNTFSDQARLTVLAKIATGSEDGTNVSVSTSASERSAWTVRAIGDWSGTIATGVEAGNADHNSNTAPDPPSISPAWGAADTMWLPIAALDGNAGFGGGTYPTNYATNGVFSGVNNSAGCQLYSSYRINNASSEDVGAWSLGATEQWVAVTIAVRPAGGTLGTVTKVAEGAAGAFANTSISSVNLTPINVPSGADLLVVGFIDNCSSTAGPTAMTWNGVSMTRVAFIGTNTDQKTSIWELANPASGSQTLAVTFGSSATRSYIASAVAFDGVDTNAPLGPISSTTNTSTSPTTAPLGFSGGYPLAFCGYYNESGNASFTSNGGQTRINSTPFSDPTGLVCDTETAVDGAQSLGFTLGGSSYQTDILGVSVHPAINNGHDLGDPADIATGEPSVGSPAITQLHALTATGTSTAAPSVGAPAVTQQHALAATGVATGAPSVGSPALTVGYVLTATGIATGAPTVGSPAISQRHALTASAVASGAPSTGSPAISQAHGLTASSIAAGAPSVGSPALNQLHALAATGAAAGAPTTGSPAISQHHVLTATGIATGAPTVGSPTLAESGTLVAESISAGTPSCGSPALAQHHIIGASVTAAGAPTVGQPALAQTHALAATGIAAGSPTVGAPAIAQRHAFTTANVSTGVPTVGTPAIGQAHALTATGTSTAAPSVGAPALGSQINLVAVGVQTGQPSTGTPALAQHHVLVAGGLVSGTPSVSSPPLQQGHTLVAQGVSTAAPSVGAPAILETFVSSPDRRLVIEALLRSIGVAPHTRILELEAVSRSIRIDKNQP